MLLNNEDSVYIVLFPCNFFLCVVLRIELRSSCMLNIHYYWSIAPLIWFWGLFSKSGYKLWPALTGCQGFGCGCLCVPFMAYFFILADGLTSSVTTMTRFPYHRKLVFTGRCSHSSCLTYVQIIPAKTNSRRVLTERVRLQDFSQVRHRRGSMTKHMK